MSGTASVYLRGAANLDEVVRLAEGAVGVALSANPGHRPARLIDECLVMADATDELPDFGNIEFSKYSWLVDVDGHERETRVRLARMVFEACKTAGYPAMLLDNVETKLDEWAP